MGANQQLLGSISVAGGIDQANLIIEIPFDEGSGWHAGNLKALDNSNMFLFPEGPFPLSQVWANSGAVFTSGITDPFGGTNAWSVSNLTDYFVQNLKGFTSGQQYTFSGWFKSNTGSAQNIRLVADDYLGTNAIATTWTFVSRTFTAGGLTLFMAVANDGANAADVSFYGLKVQSGATATTFTNTGNFSLAGGAPQWLSTGLDFNGSTLRWGAGQIRPASFTEVTIYAVFNWPMANDPNFDAIVPVLSTASQDIDQIYMTVGGGFGANSIFPCGRFQGGFVKAIGAVLRDSNWHLLTFTYDGMDLRYYVDALEIARVSAPGLSAATVKNLWLDNQGFSGWLPGALAYLTMYSVAHNGAKIMNQLSAYGLALAGRGIVLSEPSFFVASEGDSITNGTGKIPYPVSGATTFGATQGHVFAIPGNTIADVSARAAQVDALFASEIEGCVVSVLLGVNDFAGGTSAATFKANVKTYCLARRAAGWKIILCTLTPTTESAYNTFRASVNALFHGDASFYDALCDFAADPVMGPDAAASNGALYSDGVHPTQLGQNNLGAIFVPALASVFP